ncbi:hypothetical protein AV530_012707 [Patagioenas fasciata monilis]|uniref:Uncharacterized protein n=1 Tax=Patagioenas fasciata monilis TaxID=372326 RepID=A0A1V4JD81_PATFA|nr:hypothetical protein AV530_012707 [Patagioenas fasciata monilis]
MGRRNVSSADEIEEKGLKVQKASNTVKIRDEMTNPSVCPFHFRGESEEESNIVAPIVKITPGGKNLKIYQEITQKALTWVDIVRSFTALFPSSDHLRYNQAFESICQLYILGKRAFTGSVKWAGTQRCEPGASRK